MAGRLLRPSPETLRRSSMLAELACSSSSTPLLLCRQMLRAGDIPDGRTFFYIVKEATSSKNRGSPEQIHSQALKRGLAPDEFIAGGLAELYSATGRPGSAMKMFEEIPHPGLIFWTIVIRALVSSGCPKTAMALFLEMRSETELKPDEVTLSVVLSAATQIRNPSAAMAIHSLLLKTRPDLDAFLTTELVRCYGASGLVLDALQVFLESPHKKTSLVLHNAMIHQLAGSGLLPEALRLFHQMPQKDVISWNTITSALCNSGQYQAALQFFLVMMKSRLKPNELVLCTALSACSAVGALKSGACIHASITKRPLNADSSMTAALVDMYAKCGSLESALKVFDGSPQRRSLYSWTSIICGLAAHGRARHALRLFDKMLASGIRPDRVTLIGILTACAHAGLLEEGLRIFLSMEAELRVAPREEHFGCMIDLLARRGHLSEGYAMATSMPMPPSPPVWGALLSGCRLYGDAELGLAVAKRLMDLEPSDPWARIMVAGMYAEADLWGPAARIWRQTRVEVGPKRVAGFSCIEVNGRVTEFLAGDHHAELASILYTIPRHMSSNILSCQ